jgi:hypothetical protein
MPGRPVGEVDLLRHESSRMDNTAMHFHNIYAGKVHKNFNTIRNILKPHCIQSSRVLVPRAGTSKSTLRRHGIQVVTRVLAYVADAVTL